VTEDQARNTICPKLSLLVPGINNGYYLEVVNCMASDCTIWVSTDNECRPQNHENQKEICESAGHCGLAK